MGTPERTVDVMDILRCLMVSERSRFMRFCEYCGTEIVEGSKFCSVCGNQIQPAFDAGKNADNTDLDVVKESAPQVKVDPAIVRKAMSGDADAFQSLYEKTYRSNLYIARKYMKDDAAADDVLQDAYIKIWNNLSTLQTPEGFVNWARKIVATTALNELRKKTPILFGDLIEDGKDGEDIEFEVEDTYVPNNPEISFVENEEQEIIREMINSLSDEQRMCVLMYYIEDMSVNEIAEAIGCSTGTVKSRLNYGRKNIKAKVEELQKRGYNFKGISALAVFVFLMKKGFTAANAMPTAIPASPVTTTAVNAPATGVNSGNQMVQNSANTSNSQISSANQQAVQPRLQEAPQPANNPVPQPAKAPAPKAPVPKGAGFLSSINLKIFIPIMAMIAVVGIGAMYLISKNLQKEDKLTAEIEATEDVDDADEDDSSSDEEVASADDAEEEAAEDKDEHKGIASKSDDEASENDEEDDYDSTEVADADNAPKEYDYMSCNMIYGFGWYSRFDTNLLETIDEGEDETGVTYQTLKYDVTDTGSGYELIGKLTIPNRISDTNYWEFINDAIGDYTQVEVDDPDSTYQKYETVYDVKEGASFKNLGKTYTIESYYKDDNGRGYCTLLGDDGKTYTISNDLSAKMDNLGDGLFLDIYCVDDDSLYLTYEKVKIFVPYGSGMDDIISSLQNSNNGNPTNEIFGIKIDEDGNVTDICGSTSDIMGIGDGN